MLQRNGERWHKMDQTFLEVLVARKRNMAAAVLKIVCGILSVFSLILVPYTVFFLAGALLFGAGAYFFYLQEWIEFEYSYVCRELTVDRIMARSRRKSEADYLVDKIEIGAPEDSYHLDGFRNRNCTVKDYSSRSGRKKYVFYYEGQIKVVLDADEGLVQALHGAAPGKLFLH